MSQDYEHDPILSRYFEKKEHQPLDKYEKLMQRIRKLPISPRELGIEDDLELLQISIEEGNFDDDVYELLEETIKNLEGQLLKNPFISPEEDSFLDQGDIHIATTQDNIPVKVSFTKEHSNYITHLFICGQVGSGKSYLQAQLVSNASAQCYTLIIDSSRFFRNITKMQHTHKFIRLSDLRINPWDSIDGMNTLLVDQLINHIIAQHYGLQFGEYELNEACAIIRQRGNTPNIKSLIKEIKSKINYFKYNSRNQYRESAVIVLSEMLNTTGELFNCEKGMNIEDIASDNVVFEIDGLARNQSFVTSLIIMHIVILSLSNIQLNKPLILALDEGQVLANTDRSNLAQLMLQLRHYGIHLLINYQNISTAPMEILGNCDAIISFQCIDSRDKTTYGRIANLTQEQIECLPILVPGECCCFFPRLNWKRPFIANTNILHSNIKNDFEISQQSKSHTSQFYWKPILETLEKDKTTDKETGEEGNITNDENEMDAENTTNIDKQAEAFMRDVLNQEYEFSPATQRWERAGIRSASTQQAILRKLFSDGMILQHNLQKNKKGSPIRLYEPTEKAFTKYGIKWKQSGRGTLATRAATYYLIRDKLSPMGNWRYFEEGELEGKQVDILCRDKENKVISIEIAGATGKHEAHNALHCIKCEEVIKHIVVCLGKKVLEEVQKKFKEHEELHKNPKIEIVTLAIALSKEWSI